MVTFCMTLVHASLDNRTDQIRLSSDSRYQLATEAADGRWVGANPVGHTRAGKQGGSARVLSPEIAGILPEVSRLFFKAVRAGLARGDVSAYRRLQSIINSVEASGHY